MQKNNNEKRTNKKGRKEVFPVGKKRWYHTVTGAETMESKVIITNALILQPQNSPTGM